jgi:hypothetical protein
MVRLVLALVCLVCVGASSSCSSTDCGGPIFWGPVSACLFNSTVPLQSVNNAICSSGSTLFSCLAQNFDMGVSIVCT